MKKVIVFGAGVSGLGAIKTLEKNAYETFLVDDKLAEINEALSSKEAMEIIENEDIDLFIKSPGIPYTELIEKAKKKNIEIIDDIELGYRHKIENKIKGKIIAITGTNGKTTITTKIKELLEYSGFKAEACGNIGNSFSETVSNEKDVDFYILEMSSYQLENIKTFKADIALISNLTPDHLSRYKDEDDYYSTKFRIGLNQDKNDYIIINASCEDSLKRVDTLTGTVIYVQKENLKNKEDIIPTVKVADGKLFYNKEFILENNMITLKGEHNLENIMFIVCVAKILKIPKDTIRNFLYSTKTLEHRMEEFHSYGKLNFVNDSKGTNVESTNFAIDAFQFPILICGGYDKKLDLSDLCKKIKENVKEVYLIGEISNEIEKKLVEINYPKDKIYNLKELEKVVKLLKEKYNENDKNIILFSPATSSFDQYKNFEERGEDFKTLIKTYFSLF